APTVTTRYRWFFPGAEDARPGKSGIARVVLVADQHHGHRIPTSLSVRAADPTWQLIGQDLSDRTGAVQFPTQPSAPAAYRLVFEGTPVFRPSHSGIV